MTTTSVVIPALNEKKNLERLIPELKKRNLDSIYIIDDGSDDGTPEIKKGYPDVHLLFRSGRLGLISAELDGMRLSDSDYVVVMDADLSHRPEDINGMIDQAIKTSSDLVIGSRYTENGVTDDEFIRQIISRSANLLFHVAFNIDIKDCTSGFRVYSRRACEFLAHQIDIENGYVGQVDIVNRLVNNNFKITEYPVKFVKRTEGKSKLKMREIVNFFLFVIYNRKIMNYIYGTIILIIFLTVLSYLVVLLSFHI
ncbi:MULTISPECIES: polyprenol monophosphomannose synthase [Acidiplasma]|uniref:Dolichol-phosphate mannosyltransferase n=1 Tax=Acidiplasma cupricumulans TaxID=312540 RepID=A0A0Q0XK01_9ARCH|nr:MULTISPECIES: polyprenol monophosphomannose synthase [Acidiplasma]KQB35327.1 dolichol-phosphate mannosyltransferase [Acidiplasma cupricumulans]